MKQHINDKWWLQQDDRVEGVFFLGLTTLGLARLGIVWNLVPRTNTELVQGKPFINVESSKSLCPLIAPVNGTVVEWNEKILDMPDLLTSDEWLIRLSQ